MKFLSTPSARRATSRWRRSWWHQQISIHALREEGDRSSQRACRSRFDFYPRPPRGGRLVVQVKLQLFMQISIHALREEGDQGVRGSCVNFIISIHALREEGDVGFLHLDHRFGKFLSTPSARRATFMVLLPPDVRFDFYPRPPRGGRPQVGVKGDVAYNISIHALREEGDSGCP